MRKLYFLLPGTSSQFACGGLWAELKTLALAQQLVSAEVVTYRQRQSDALFLDDVLQQPDLSQAIFVMSWGFDVPKLAKRLIARRCHIVYHAHSAGYGFKLPAQIPIVTVSRNSMGYWGQQSPHALIYYLPNQISEQFCNFNAPREIDVLVQARKSSQYLFKELIPALQQHGRVKVIDTYVEDLPALFNQTKVYLYDSAEYWAQQQVSEGFGLQPMEALACGCQVFSSVNGGLSDYLDPGFNCYKIAGYAREYDVQRILKAIEQFPIFTPPEEFFAEYRTENILKRLQVILTDLNQFFDLPHPVTPIADLTPLRLMRLTMQSKFGKLRKKLVR